MALLSYLRLYMDKPGQDLKRTLVIPAQAGIQWTLKKDRTA